MLILSRMLIVNYENYWWSQGAVKYAIEHEIQCIWSPICYIHLSLQSTSRCNHFTVIIGCMAHYNYAIIHPCSNLRLAMSTHLGRAAHICFNELTIIGSDNGLSPSRRRAIIWINDGMLLIGPLGTKFSESQSKLILHHSRKCVWKCRLENVGHIVSASMCLMEEIPDQRVLRTNNYRSY